MSYTIIWSPKSEEGLAKLETRIQLRIIRKVQDLKLAPYHFIERMTDENAWKLRIGDYRAILDVKEREKEIHVIKVGHRKNVYK